VNSTRQAQLLTLLEKEIATSNAGSLTKVQLQKQRDFFVSGNVAAAELIHWSVAFVNAAPNTGYASVLAGLMVRILLLGDASSVNMPVGSTPSAVVAW
jgi:hypothetical protein